MEVQERIEGVVIGLLIGFEGGYPLVVYIGNPQDGAVQTRSLVELDANAVGCEVALLFEGGDRTRPLVVGRVVDPSRRTKPVLAERDGETVVVSANERIEFRCGKASIILEKDGRISIRGSQVTSLASGTNWIRGGSVHLN